VCGDMFRSLLSTLKVRARTFMRPIVRIFLYYIYETPYAMGSGGRLIISKNVAVANSLFNLSSGSIHVVDYTYLVKM
jgi:hypothetical protein